MDEQVKLVHETDVLVIGAGAGGLWAALSAALSAKEHGTPRLKVTIIDGRVVGRTGHTVFSAHGQTTVFPDQDPDECVRDIIEGNSWMADQELVREVLAGSFERLRDMEKMGIEFLKKDGGYDRHRPRGLKVCYSAAPVGGGALVCWKMRQKLLEVGVHVLDQLFVTDLLTDDDGQVVGALAIHSRSGDFCVLKARAVIIATNAPTFRAGFGRDQTGTGTILAYDVGAALTNAEFSYLRPAFPKFYFEGIQGANPKLTNQTYHKRYVNALGEYFMERYDPELADSADALVVCKAMVMEKLAGRAPIYLDFSMEPPEKRWRFFVRAPWMNKFRVGLKQRLGIELFSKQEAYPLAQMTKMAIQTDSHCYSSVPGLFAAGLAQAGAATHFNSFHLGMAVGTGWISGRSAVNWAVNTVSRRIDPSWVEERVSNHLARFDRQARVNPEEGILRELQGIMFHYSVSILKDAAELKRVSPRIEELDDACQQLRVSNVHDFVRLKETECMTSAARIILAASLMRTESRLSHMRVDHLERDDAHWLKRIVVKRREGKTELSTQDVLTPLYPPPGAAKAMPA